jgi:NAD(P)-dependent dehydrogenase (short-subunit alcohol dehydrogenase family)
MSTTDGAARPIAFVTGASRGIGKAIARQVAKAGFDVAITARTVQEGESREHSSSIKQSNTKPLPGSLTSTAAEVEAAGVRCLVVQADLLDRASLGAAVATVHERWGTIDLLVNNGRYIGPGHMDQVIDTPLELLDRHLEANVMAPLVLAKTALPAMRAAGRGTIINITSASGQMDPQQPAGEGGWGLGYGMSKAALHRIAGILAVELGKDGIHAFNVNPGFVWTERLEADMAEFGFDASAGAPPDVIGVAVAWLATHLDEVPNGSVFEAQDEVATRGLLPGWPKKG